MNFRHVNHKYIVLVKNSVIYLMLTCEYNVITH